ncbi:hypothetical protein FSP39_017986 [Pinctada imbricata]|uniref:Tetraspanin n=1 Tax=Pinctada imbricata TaxID=66713 RepID=A0AA88Y7C6_PINIB|nr:hypothetical protein FSP39_017986 [Pinctada imbricata]
MLGVALLVIGCLVRFNQDSLVTENAEKLFEAIELDAASDINLKDFLNSVALVFIVSGAFAAIVGLSGCIGACCEVKFLLVVYSIFVLLILAAQIAGVVMMFLIRSDVEKVLKREMKESIQEKYEGDKSSNGLSLAWNSIFLEFDCCGVDNYTDIIGGAMWNNNYTQSNNNTVTLMTPITCCKNIQGSVPDFTIPDDLTCAVNPSDSNSNYKKVSLSRGSHVTFCVNRKWMSVLAGITVLNAFSIEVYGAPISVQFHPTSLITFTQMIHYISFIHRTSFRSIFHP